MRLTLDQPQPLSHLGLARTRWTEHPTLCRIMERWRAGTCYARDATAHATATATAHATAHATATATAISSDAGAGGVQGRGAGGCFRAHHASAPAGLRLLARSCHSSSVGQRLAGPALVGGH